MRRRQGNPVLRLVLAALLLASLVPLSSRADRGGSSSKRTPKPTVEVPASDPDPDPFPVSAPSAPPVEPDAPKANPKPHKQSDTSRPQQTPPREEGGAALPVVVAVAGNVFVAVLLGAILFVVNRNIGRSFSEAELKLLRIERAVDALQRAQPAAGSRDGDRLASALQEVEALVRKLSAQAKEPRGPQPGPPATPPRRAASPGSPPLPGGLRGTAPSPSPFAVPADPAAVLAEAPRPAANGRALYRGLVRELLDRKVPDVFLGTHLVERDQLEERSDGEYAGFVDGDHVWVVPSFAELSDSQHFHDALEAVFHCSDPQRGEIHVETPARLVRGRSGRWVVDSPGRIVVA